VKIILYIIAAILIIIIGCESPQDLNRPGDKMDGYITYSDTNLLTINGYYSVSVYNAEVQDPLNRIPIRTDSLKDFYKMGLHYEVMYSMDGIPAGKFYVAATWSRYPKVANEIPIVLGTYGCDTSSSCSSHKVIIYPNTEGNFRNIYAWTDTTKHLN